ncbi:PAS domain S-box protein [Roseovarius arcticus]|uniref:PAS domain S-box protein n=1 Tax=Roseovarius arcticus TaxID=2547404 RepID=UPI001110DB27|nr:PAS domain S-box protein [Roseovarius arcticus]
MDTRESVQQHLAAIVEGSDDAIITKGLDSLIQSWNPGAEQLFGYSAKEAIGQPITMLFPADRVAEEEDFIARLSRGEKIAHFETVRKCKDGTLVPISLTVSPVRDANGNVIGASKIARDITLRHVAEERQELRAREGDALLAVSQKLLEDVSLDEFIQFCLDTVCSVASMDAGHLQVVRGQGDNARLHPTGIWHLASSRLEAAVKATELLRFTPGEGLPGLAWESGELQFLDDVTRSERFLRSKAFEQIGLVRAVALPVRQGGEIRAILEFFGSSKARLDADILRMIQTVGSQIGVAIHRKQEAEGRETLRREMTHRVGNSLSVLTSIYRSCSRAAQSKDELDKAFLGRLVAVGNANRLSIENATEGATLSSLVREAIEIFPEPDRVEINVIDLMIDCESVMPLALILNELATNTLKHNDLCADSRLTINANFDEAAEQVVLEWEELHAAPLVTPPPEPTRVGFGTQLMQVMIESRLRGSFERKLDQTGLHVAIRLPRERIDAQAHGLTSCEQTRPD